jgi:hypothetical protein
MKRDDPPKKLHELKRRNATPVPLIEMFDALVSLDPGLSAKREARNDRRNLGQGMATTGTQGRLIHDRGHIGIRNDQRRLRLLDSRDFRSGRTIRRKSQVGRRPATDAPANANLNAYPIDVIKRTGRART